MFVGLQLEGALLNALEKRKKDTGMAKSSIMKAALWEYLQGGTNGK